MWHAVPIVGHDSTRLLNRCLRLVVEDVSGPDLPVLIVDVIVNYLGMRLYAEDVGVHIGEVGNV